MKFNKSSFAIVLMAGSMLTACGTSANVASSSGTSEKRSVESNNNQEAPTELRNYKNVENKTNRVSEFKVVQKP